MRADAVSGNSFPQLIVSLVEEHGLTLITLCLNVQLSCHLPHLTL